MDDNFAHVHLHSEYSYLDGLSRVWDTAAKAPCDLPLRIKELGQKYCAITDHGSTSGWVRFDKAMKKLELSPIFGIEGYYCDDMNKKGMEESEKLAASRGLVGKAKREAIRKAETAAGLLKRSHFVCWAMNEKGITEILKTQSIASTTGFYYKPRWDFTLIKQMKNCIFGTACGGGILNWYLNANRPSKEVFVEAEKWKNELGDRFYIELQPIDWEQQRSYNKYCWLIANQLGIKCYLANDSHYVKQEDWEAHDILLAIQSSFGIPNPDALNDPNRLRYDMHDLYVKSRKEMFSSFYKHNDINTYPKSVVSEMLDNTIEIAERCHHGIIKKKMIMPNLKIPNDMKPIDYFKYLIAKGWQKKIVPYVPKENWPKYKEQLNYEFKEITRQGFTPYFILVNKMMRWVDKQGIARGPARGSSAGSLIAYLLDITMIDPIPHKLLFSRFIDPNRTDFPDIDMDFEDKRRREIVEYLIRTYGEQNVAILGNNITFKPKLVLKDVSRLFHVPQFDVQHLCELVIVRSGADSRLSFCLEDTFKQFKFAQDFESKYPKVAQFSKRLEGLTKNFGVHAAGVVIADGDINNYTALKYDRRQKEFKVSTIDKHDAEDIGLLKLDVLGLNTIAIIQEARRLVQKRHNRDIILEDLCRDVTYNGGDKAVYQEFASGNVVGVFQFNTPGLERLAVQVKIEKFSELADCTALHRPGPIHSGAMAKYPGIKFGVVKKFSPLHQIVKEETEDTYGLILYQEQVMQIARKLGNYTWAQTNEIRKVMSKSGGAEYFMTHYWEPFKKGCAEHNVDEKTALRIFKRINTMGSWSFNLSHAVSYAFVSYFCMWFKVHYPIEYCVAYLNYVHDTDGEKIKQMVGEVKRLGITLTEPDINHSKTGFSIHGGRIVAGLDKIKHVGHKAVQTIMDNQPYGNFIEFITKIDKRACNIRAIRNLITVGAFDGLGYDKDKLLDNIEQIHKRAKFGNEKSMKIVRQLVSECRGKSETGTQRDAERMRSITPVYVGKHISRYYDDIVSKFGKHIKITKLKDIEMDISKQGDTQVNMDKRPELVRLDVWVMGLFGKPDLKRLSQEVKELIDKGEEQRYALANLEDDTDFIVLSFREGAYLRYEQKLFDFKDKIVLVHGTVNKGWKKCYVDELFVLDDVRKYLAAGRKPFDYRMDYLFTHTLHKYFDHRGGPAAMRKKYECRPLVDLKKLKMWSSIYCLGVVTSIVENTIRKEGSELFGKKWYWVSFEDETFVGSFMIFPNDFRYIQMKRDIFDVYAKGEPVILYIQRDSKFHPEDMEDDNVKKVSMSLDKRTPWNKICFRKFHIKSN